MQTGQENAQLSNWPIITKYLVENDDYYISYYSAMRLHGMTTHALREAIVTTPKRRRAKKVSNFSYNFIYTKAEYIWGVEMHWVSQQDNVCISDLERTLLDGLARPELCGGIKEIVRGIWVKQEQINWDKVLQYAAKFHTKAAVKRLGFIFELLHLGESYVPQLAQITSSAKDYILLDPGSPKTGRYLERWHIRLNVNIEELKESIWG
ncbi:MAG: type IV toxin-antitoxin system AbiEi family antitoxin [Gammaproteobacteria bacterium]